MGMAGWFEISNRSDRQFQFVLKARVGKTMMACELYETGWHDGSGVSQTIKTQRTPDCLVVPPEKFATFLRS